MKDKSNIVLVGFMGVGKSTVSAALAQLTGYSQVDTDDLLVQEFGKSISEVFAQQGEAVFRNAESALCQRLSQPQGLVVSCGGGVVLRPQNVAALQKGGKIVLLTATPETILSRVARDESRPLLRGRKTVEGIRELLAARQPAYRAAAELTVATDGKTARQIAEEIICALGFAG